MKENKKVFAGLICFAAVLFIYALYKIHFGFHKDEAVCLESGDMVYRGVRMLSENWHFMQFYSFFQIPFYMLHKALFGSYDGIILGMRYVYIGMQTVIALYTYKTLRLFVSKNKSLLMAIVAFCYYFNWHSITYKNYFYFFTYMMFLFLLRYHKTDKWIYNVLAALSLSGAVLSYQGTVVLLIPVILIFMKKYGKTKKSVKAIIIFAGTCFLCACMLIGYIIWNSTIDEVLQGVYMLFHIESTGHSVSRSPLKLILEVCLVGAAAQTVVLFYEKVVRKRFSRITSDCFLALVLAMLFVVICCGRIQTISNSRVWYTLIFAVMWFPYLIYDFKRRKLVSEKLADVLQYYFCIPTIFLMLSVVLCTNQGIAIVAYGSYLGIFGMIILALHSNQKKYYAVCLSALVIGGFVYFVPDASGGNTNIFQTRYEVASGVAKGLHVQQDVYEKYVMLEDAVEQMVTNQDVLLIVGEEFDATMGHLMSNADYGCYATYGISPYDSALLEYYDLYPKRIPSAVIVNKEYVETMEGWRSDSPLGIYFSEKGYQNVYENDIYMVMK